MLDFLRRQKFEKVGFEDVGAAEIEVEFVEVVPTSHTEVPHEYLLRYHSIREVFRGFKEGQVDLDLYDLLRTEHSQDVRQVLIDLTLGQV